MAAAVLVVEETAALVEPEVLAAAEMVQGILELLLAVLGKPIREVGAEVALIILLVRFTQQAEQAAPVLSLSATQTTTQL